MQGQRILSAHVLSLLLCVYLLHSLNRSVPSFTQQPSNREGTRKTSHISKSFVFQDETHAETNSPCAFLRFPEEMIFSPLFQSTSQEASNINVATEGLWLAGCDPLQLSVGWTY